MALCPGCGKDIRDDIWVCGHCGELVARGGGATGGGACAGAQTSPVTAAAGAPGAGSYGGEQSGGAYAGDAYGAPAPAPLPASSGKAARGGSASRAVLLASVLGLVAVVAIVGVWFFVLRGDGGGDFSAYVGQWQLTTPGSTAALSLTIQDGEGEPQLLMGATGTYAGQTAVQTAGPYKMELQDGNLITKLEASDAASDVQKAAAEAARAALGAVVDDFKMVFAPGGTPDTLSLSMEGDIQGAGFLGADMGSQAVILTRTPGTTSAL
jgi:hypothetical protein